MSINLEHLHRVHCVGVGGIGVSAVAKLLRSMGKEVGGSDPKPGIETVADAARAGVIIKEASADNIDPDLDLLIYTSVTPETQVERVAAAKFGIPQFEYSEFLGLLSRSYETVAVCGTNGKSTTTAMLGLILEAAGLDPLVIVGSKVKTFPYGNLRPGKGRVFVVEACEYRAHFLNISPKHVVVTNVTEDHLDYYRDLAHIRETFQAFVDRMPEDGTLVVNADDRVAGSELKPKGGLRTFGLGAADVRAGRVSVKPGRQSFEVSEREGLAWDAELQVPGAFNIQNALGAAAMARALGVKPEIISKTLAEFSGIWRRFERVGTTAKGSPVISDYGHHPDALKQTLQAARDFFPDRRIVLCFEPHQHDRTRKLFDDFVASFDGADVLVISEIYGVDGRKDGEGEISSKDLVRATEERDRHEKRKRMVKYAVNPEASRQLLVDLEKKGDLIIVMGAGDIYTIAGKLVA